MNTHIIAEDGMVEIRTGVIISREASYLFSDKELIGLLRRRGIDTTRPTRIKEWGAVVYLEKMKMAS